MHFFRLHMWLEPAQCMIEDQWSTVIGQTLSHNFLSMKHKYASFHDIIIIFEYGLNVRAWNVKMKYNNISAGVAWNHIEYNMYQESLKSYIQYFVSYTTRASTTMKYLFRIFSLFLSFWVMTTLKASSPFTLEWVFLCINFPTLNLNFHHYIDLLFSFEATSTWKLTYLLFYGNNSTLINMNLEINFLYFFMAIIVLCMNLILEIIFICFYLIITVL